MSKEKGPLTPKQQKVRKALSIVANIIGVIVVIVTLFVSIMTITRTQSEERIASVFGYALMPVLSDSMEPTFDKGDLIITKLYTGDGSDLKEGDIVTIKEYNNGVLFYNTHRIVDIKEEGPYTSSDGTPYYTRYFYTQGDNVDERDHDSRYYFQFAATYTGIRLKGVGQVVTKLQTDPKFYFLVVVTPLILLFVIYVFFFVRAIIQMKLQKTKQEALAAAAAAGGDEAPKPKISLDELSDEEKLRLLLELQAKKNAQASAEKPADQSADIQKPEDITSEPQPVSAPKKAAPKKAQPKAQTEADGGEKPAKKPAAKNPKTENE
jgi:signal peptidase